MPADVHSEHSRPSPRTCTVRPKHKRFVLRPIIDGAATWIVFCVLTTMVTCAPISADANPAGFGGIERAAAHAAVKAVGEPGPAPIIEIATTSASTNPDAVFRRTSATAAWGLLGFALSLLAAVNLTLFRHLRRAYAPPKRRQTKPRVSPSGDVRRY